MSYKKIIISKLDELRFTPKLLDDLKIEYFLLRDHIKELHPNETIGELLNKKNSLANQLLYNSFLVFLTQKPYYDARVNFLEKLVGYIKKSGTKEILDDPCFSGLDLYCLDSIFGNNISLSGVERNSLFRKYALKTNPDLTVSRNIPQRGSYDLIYNDFFYFFNRTKKVINPLLFRYNSLLKKDGVLIQNVDLPLLKISSYENYLTEFFDREDKIILGGGRARLDNVDKEVQFNMYIWRKIKEKKEL